MIKKFFKNVLIFLFGNKLRIMKMREGLFKGIFLEINIKNQLALIFGSPEVHLQEVLKKHIKADDLVFDIGANIGYVSIAMSKLVGRKGKVYSFEAIPETAQKCMRNLNLNSCNNVFLTNKAVSHKAEKVIFRIPEDGENHPMASMVWHKKMENIKNIEVETIVIDSDLRFNSLSPSFLKIDVEGAEGNVVLGMEKLIKKCHPVIFIECSKAGRKIVWEVLKKIHYSCYHAVTKEHISEFKKYWSDDFIWIPKNKIL